MDERSILEFYRLQTLNPTEWPAENNSDASDSEDEEKRKKLQRRKSRYQALERSTTRRSLMGSEPSGKGGGLVMKDEPDPLGTTDSVIRTLRQLGLPVQENPRIRNRFLLSSTAFTPSLFLSQLHANADSKSLVAGLDALTRSIDEKSASLKVLVESNFERFVKAKATIDNVYKEMKYRGAEQPAQGLARGHSRHASRSSFRNSPLNNPVSSPVNDARRKNALVKESEYGVVGIKTPLLDVTAKAEDVWGPALGGREKEESLKTISANIERFKEYTELSAAIADSIKRKDYESLVEEYNRARRIADEARSTTQNLAGDATPSDQQLYQIILACRMWHDVDEQMKSFKREIWRSLTSVHTVSRTENLPSHPEDRHMELISLLLELGVDDNPIWLWLLSRYDFLKGRIQMTAERAKVEIEILRRRLANADKPSPQGTASYLRSLSRQSMENKPSLLDSGDVIEFWEKTLSFITTILSPQGLLGEILEFWDTAKGFTSGTTQKTLPGGFNGESKKFHRLSVEGTTSLEKAVVELTPISGTLSPGGMRFSLNANNLPPPSPKRGEAWEKFAFWPPWSNSVSGVHYLSKILALIGAGAAELATIQPLGGSEGVAVERLKALVGAARERSVTALCAAWNKDAENIKYVEDWHRAESGDVTRMPASFAAFEGSLLGGMQKILYISEAMAKPGAEYIVLPPQAKLLQMVRSQYVTTLYKALSGMVENAERSLKQTDDEWTTDIDGPAVASSGPAGPAGKGTLDASDRNVRMLLTLSNLQALRATVVPALNTQFENAFSVKLTDESKTIRDVLGQIDARLFQTYTRPFVDSSKSIIKAGIADPGWSPPPGKNPTEARPYIYELLLNLVLVHTQVSTTAPSLTSQVLSFLLEQVTRELLETYRSRQRYTLEGLMQATLDVEFVAQTLSQYTTERASELQAQVYQELDSRTDDSTRARLQGELPEMRVVLKRLREGSKMEFACFRKARRAAGGGSQG
ncbi:related to SEC5 protein [Cephalotrichum gorgonifer]|uniref:Exocyst complex component SEC5 n=1 Tax=Cephalotrichum gorgonifer TaxID=2041049 RepID=A0AAE8MT88_9PEZI|nr:related to SEC5 protein [Cephalotrichum gorgonifer]